MGYSNSQSPEAIASKENIRLGRKVRETFDMMKRHPNYQPLAPEPNDTLVSFSLRWAAHLISPPQEPGESYDLECVDIAEAVIALEPEIIAAWKQSPNGTRKI